MIRIPTHRPPTHPGQMLSEEFLKPLAITQREFAKRLGVSYPRPTQLVRGRWSVTPDTAVRRERLLGTEAQFWLNLQLAHDLSLARRSPIATAIRRLTPLPPLRRAS